MVWLAELIAFAGFAAIVYGVSLWSEAAAWIVVGSVLMLRAGSALNEIRGTSKASARSAREVSA